MRELPLPCPAHSFDEPTATPARRRPLAVIPEHVKLVVKVDPVARTAVGQVWHTVRARAAAVDRVTLDAADLVVDAVVDAAGEPLEFFQHSSGVDVHLHLAPEARTTFALHFRATPTRGLHFVDADAAGPAAAWTQGAMEDHHHWFPCFDAPEHVVTTEVVAEGPPGYRVLSNGVPLGDGHWRHDTPHALYLLTLVVDRLSEVVDTGASVPLFHYVPEGREADAKVLFERMPAMLDFFAFTTGVPYPYPRYGHVFLREFMWGGMENTTLTSLTDFALVAGHHRDEFDVERLFAHELAHQWFGDLIAPRGWPELWLNESFATWFEQRCMGVLNGEDDFVRRLVAQRDSYLGEFRDRYSRGVVAKKYAHPYVLFDRHAYEKGCLVLETLRHQLGPVAFDAGLKRYVAQARGTAADSGTLRRALEEASGADLAEFFEHFVDGPGHPQVAVTWLYDPRVGLELTLSRQDDGPQSIYLDVWIQARALHRHRVRLTPGTRTLVVPLPEAPLWVAVDPELRAPVVVLDESAEPEAALVARLATGPLALRLRTVRLLAGRGDPIHTEALARVLAEDASPTVRAEAAAALGEHRSDAARKVLMAALQVIETPDDSAWRVRMAAAAALGVGADRGLLDFISTLLVTEPRYRVKAALLTTLGHIKDEAAQHVLERFLDQPSPRDCIAGAAAEALAAQGRPEVVDLLLLRTERGHSRVLRQAAIGGLARLARKDEVDAAKRRRIREAFEGLLSDAGFHVRVSAANALKSLADPTTRAALERAHGAERFALIRRLLREALGALPG